MAAPQFGTPTGTATRPTASFNHVPDALDLMRNGGIPGITYVQVCSHNVMRARERGLRPISGADFYSVTGVKGTAEMVLMGEGKPIPGASPDGGARLFYTDSEVERLTGHRTDPEFTVNFREDASNGEISEPSIADSTGLPAEDPAGDARVQGGGAAQRQQARPAGNKS